jgi:vacuolar-type H+-ATPase subunit I/STV1
MKILSLALIVPLLLATVSPAFAEQNKRQELRQENQEKRVETRQDNRQQKSQAALKRLRQGIVNRYEATLKNKARIEARIAEIEAKNNTSEKKRDLTAAKAKLATFNTSKYLADLAAFDAKSVEVASSETPYKLTSEMKTLAKTLQSDIKDLRQVLIDSLRLVIKAR